MTATNSDWDRFTRTGKVVCHNCHRDNDPKDLKGIPNTYTSLGSDWCLQCENKPEEKKHGFYSFFLKGVRQTV